MGLFFVYRNNAIKKEEERLAEIAYTYDRVNRAFFISEECYTAFTEENIHNHNYLNFALYEKQTGEVITYEQVFEYFSQEYEGGGSLRLYNNGLHPEIEAYVDWNWSAVEDRLDYRSKINMLFGEYFFEHRDEGFESTPMYEWSIEILDELIKKEADPDYEMDLLSIQIRERAEAEAQTAV